MDEYVCKNVCQVGVQPKTCSLDTNTVQNSLSSFLKFSSYERILKLKLKLADYPFWLTQSTNTKQQNIKFGNSKLDYFTKLKNSEKSAVLNNINN